MSTFRKRAQEHFPAVLLTLISIIQALALELLWARVNEAEALWQADLNAVVAWGMVSVALLGILQIWVMYSFMVMGFQWLPGLRDSIFPFLIGIQEFLLIRFIGTEYTGVWLLVLASVFVSANIISHLSLRRARHDPVNALFFRTRQPATWKDFKWAYLIVSILTLFGLVNLFYPSMQWVTLTAMVFANAMLVVQIIAVTKLWQIILELKEDSDS